MTCPVRADYLRGVEHGHHAHRNLGRRRLFLARAGNFEQFGVRILFRRIGQRNRNIGRFARGLADINPLLAITPAAPRQQPSRMKGGFALQIDVDESIAAVLQADRDRKRRGREIEIGAARDLREHRHGRRVDEPQELAQILESERAKCGFGSRRFESARHRLAPGDQARNKSCRGSCRGPPAAPQGSRFPPADRAPRTGSGPFAGPRPTDLVLPQSWPPSAARSPRSFRLRGPA